MPSAISAAMPWPLGGISCTRAPAKGCDQRAAPVGLVRGEVVLGQRAAAGAGVRRHPPRQLAAVEGLAVAVGDRLQRGGVRLAAEDLAGPRRAAAGQEAVGEAGLVAERSPPAAHSPAIIGETGKPSRA